MQHRPPYTLARLTLGMTLAQAVEAIQAAWPSAAIRCRLSEPCTEGTIIIEENINGIRRCEVGMTLAANGIIPLTKTPTE